MQGGEESNVFEIGLECRRVWSKRRSIQINKFSKNKKIKLYLFLHRILYTQTRNYE
jgi:hypothetical protein